MLKNIRSEIQNNILTITVDLSQSFGETKSKKSTLIATTAGNVRIAPDRLEEMTITVYRRK